MNGKYCDSIALSDIISALSGGSIDVPIGYERNYWNKSLENIPMEIFADICSIDVFNLQEMEEILRELFEA